MKNSKFPTLESLKAYVGVVYNIAEGGIKIKRDPASDFYFVQLADGSDSKHMFKWDHGKWVELNTVFN